MKLLFESEDPLWELVRFEAEMSAAQDDKARGDSGWIGWDGFGSINQPFFSHPPSLLLQAAGVVQQRVLAHEGITAAARDFLATKLQTSNVPVRAPPFPPLFSVVHRLWLMYIHTTRPPTPHTQSPKLKLVIDAVLEAQPDLIQDLREDLLVSTMRDSSVPSLLAAFLFSKGYHAVATYRISHVIFECVCLGVRDWAVVSCRWGGSQALCVLTPTNGS